MTNTATQPTEQHTDNSHASYLMILSQIGATAPPPTPSPTPTDFQTNFIPTQTDFTSIINNQPNPPEVTETEATASPA